MNNDQEKKEEVSPRVRPSSWGDRNVLLRWVIDHDDKRAFLIGYVGLTILLTIGISLFWLFFLVGIHLCFECLKKIEDGALGWRRVLAFALWDIKFDVALLSMAMVLLVVTEIRFGLAGIAGFARFSTILSRFSGASRSFLPLKDLVLAFRIVCTRKMDRREFLQRKLLWVKAEKEADQAALKAAERERIATYRYPWNARWTVTTKIVLGIIVVNLLVILGALSIAPDPWTDLVPALKTEFHPWP
ncbi:MAG: hypothetical protein JJT75_00070 [Opitutales bacterium]|nr:hypothetical protein [Opitutales bacterium]MCH8539471.1 hypothetical protein [Opitutales bacterium]